ncbi:Dephospho-CoA kinase (plasmid) [Nostoc sp. NIES-3756]|uniref:AAA family ATPase n=1 Tax=Nostoc sp. NIES-3756 TaxID=1751286 RepID=UPI0007226FD3|nr:AAA family ATPase [Nostoc sp. NIES-3756]BAT56595.1 Dephospho-CoA kinase [Nostoc sp. NIES-3756]
MKPIILGFSGSIASGKSTLSIRIASCLKWERVSFGDYVRSVAQHQGIEVSRKVLQSVGASLINQGMEQFCCSVLEQANWRLGQPLIIDGIRHVEAVSVLRRLLFPSQLLIIFIAVNEQTRESRLIEKGLTQYEELQQIDEHSTEVEVQTRLKKMANLIVDGNKQVEQLVEEIIIWLRQQSCQES